MYLVLCAFMAGTAPVSWVRSLREEQPGQLHRPGHAGAMSLEADEATGEKPSLTLFLAGSAAW